MAGGSIGFYGDPFPFRENFHTSGPLIQGLLFWMLKGGYRVSSGIGEWYSSNYGTELDDSEIASPVIYNIDPK